MKIFNNEVYPYLSEMSFNSVEEVNDCLDWLVSAINDRPLSGQDESRNELFTIEKPSLREKLNTFCCAYRTTYSYGWQAL